MCNVYVPAGQTLTVVLPRQKLPAGQAVQVVALDPETTIKLAKEPGEHMLHVVDPSRGAPNPAAHGKQVVEFVPAPYVPVAHEAHTLEAIVL